MDPPCPFIILAQIYIWNIHLCLFVALSVNPMFTYGSSITRNAISYCLNQSKRPNPIPLNTIVYNCIYVRLHLSASIRLSYSCTGSILIFIIANVQWPLCTTQSAELRSFTESHISFTISLMPQRHRLNTVPWNKLPLIPINNTYGNSLYQIYHYIYQI